MLASGTAVAAAAIPSTAMFNCPSATPGVPSATPCAGGSTSFRACLPAAFTVCSVQRAPAVVSAAGASTYDLGSILHTTGAKGSFADVLALSAPNYTVGASLSGAALASAALPSGSWFYSCLANGPSAAVPASTCTLTVNGAPQSCSGVGAQSFAGALAVNHNLWLNDAASWAIAEVLVFARVLADAEVAALNAYFSAKYVIGLQPPGPPMRPPPSPPPPPSPALPTVPLPAGALASGLVARHTAGSFRATNASQWVRSKRRRQRGRTLSCSFLF